MRQKISRRTVLVGLTGVAALSATAGATYLAYEQFFKPSHGNDPHLLLTYPGSWRAAWSPDSTRVASAMDTAVHVWNATTGKTLLTCKPEGTTAAMTPQDVVWAADGKSVLAVVGEEVQDGQFSGLYIRAAQVWDAATGQHIRTIPISQNDPSEGLLDLNPHYLAVAVRLEVAHALFNDVVEIWDITTGSKISTLDAASSTLIIPNSSTPTPPSTPVALDTPTPTPSTRPNTNFVHELLWAPDSEKLAVISLLDGSDGGVLVFQIWDAPAGRLLHTFPKYGGISVPVIAWSPDGRSVAFGTTVYDVETGRQIMTYTVPGTLTAQAWSPNGKRVALRYYYFEGSPGFYVPTLSSIALVDASSGRQIALYEEGPVTRGLPGSGAGTMAWSPNGKNVMVVWDGVEIWRGEEG